jgi:hypothetical protein
MSHNWDMFSMLICTVANQNRTKKLLRIEDIHPFKKQKFNQYKSLSEFMYDDNSSGVIYYKD